MLIGDYHQGGAESNAYVRYNTELPHPVAEVCCVCLWNEVRLGGGLAGVGVLPLMFSRRQVPSESLRPAVEMKTLLSSLETINY